MKKSYYLIAFIGLAIILIGILLFLRGDEDAWICSNGEWVKHGNPPALEPTTECTKSTEKKSQETTTSVSY